MRLRGRELSEGMRGEDVGELQDELTRLGGEVSEKERSRQHFGKATTVAVVRFQQANELDANGVVDATTARALSIALGDDQGTDDRPEKEDGSKPPDGPRRVFGRVTRAGESLPGAEVVAFAVHLAREDEVGKTVTDSQGHFDLSYRSGANGRSSEDVDLRLRTFFDGVEAGASPILYDAAAEVRLDVVVDEVAHERDEHTRLIATLDRSLEQTSDVGRIGDLQETDERPDITYLANKTGWDARAVAMASAADRLAASTGIGSSLYYALFRAGLPADPDALARVPTDIVRNVVLQSIKEQIVPDDLESVLPDLLDRFHELSSISILQQPATTGVSPLGEVLSVAGLNDEEKGLIASTYARSADVESFWETLGEVGERDLVDRTAAVGKLAYLTLNNAPLMAKMIETADVRGVADLANAGLYAADQWSELLTDDVSVPKEIAGEDEDARRRNYAEFLAAQVEVSYPTAVVGAMLLRGEIATSARPEVKEEAGAFLLEHHGRFELGARPLQAYLTSEEVDLSEETTAALRTLQLQYQITPSNQAMGALARNELDSAYAVTRYDQQSFVARFQRELGVQTAELVYSKARQVQNAVFNIATTYVLGKSNPEIYAIPSGTFGPKMDPEEDETFADVIAYPTLEELFGEMDYCACEHCRSVLSPAAYLVDILSFIDLRKYNAAGTLLPADYEGENPIEVLLSRRPDLAQIELTCENTNVALPQIDLVNEILEHFVIHKSLDSFEGHDVEPGVTSEELMTSPRFVEQAAYSILAGETYPFMLPFHRPLTALRAYMERFGVPLSEAMEIVSKTEDLDPSAGDLYGWRDILIERLGIQRGEYHLLTAPDTPLAALYGAAPGTEDDAVIDEIENAKTFARRVGITYEEVIDVLRTRFVNPDSWLLPRVERLRLTFAAIQAHHDGDGEDFTQDLPPDFDYAPYDGDPGAWLEAHYESIANLVVLTDPTGANDLCSFDDLELRHALPHPGESPLSPVEALRLVRFVRLWRRLGWSIEQTDKVLTSLFPAEHLPQDGDDQPTARGRLGAGLEETLLRVAHLRAVMKRLGLHASRDLEPALALWSPIDVMGRNSHYRRMFLHPSILAIDDTFREDGSGNVLTGTELLLGHRVALQAAFKLNADELDSIVAAAGFDATTPLTLQNVTVVFRYGFVARRLKLSVRELVALVEIAGIDPFAAPTSPRPPLLDFIDVVSRLREGGIQPPLLMYLVRHELPAAGAPPREDVVSLAKTLHDDLDRIEREHAVVDDPTGDIGRAKMALVYPPEAADMFFGILGASSSATGTLRSEVPYSQTGPALPAAAIAAAPGIAYDHFAKHMSFSGVMTLAQRDALIALPGMPPAFPGAVTALHTAGEKASLEFFDRYPDLAALHSAVSALPAEQRASSVLLHFLPALRQRLKEMHVLQLISADAGMTPAEIDPLLRDPLVLHSVVDPASPALDDVLALGAGGVSATIFDGPDTTGPSRSERIVEILSYDADRPLPVNTVDPNGPISGIWHWFADPPANGFYTFSIAADPAAVIELEVDGHPIALAQSNGDWSTQETIELKVGHLHHVRLTAKSVTSRLSIQWETIGRPKEFVGAKSGRPGDVLDDFIESYTRLLKVFALAAQLGLDGLEIGWFATRPELAIAGKSWLNGLPVALENDPAIAEALLRGVQQLTTYARLRSDLKVKGHELLRILEDPSRTNDMGVTERSVLTGWTDEEVSTVLTHLGLTEQALSRIETLETVARRLDLARDVGIPAGTLLPNVTNDPTEEMVASIQGAIRSRYEEDAWDDVARPVNDALRDAQRDALLGFVLHWMKSHAETEHIDTAEKLFEYFLIDVAMEPCTLTSRIRQALSSVQLFIQRCLLNLETRVDPSSINARRWAWMKRYRVWEANRKIFLFPENWLEPELRDNKSPFFKDLESELLESDINEDSAAIALGHYLEKLSEVANLEICGMAVEESDITTPADDTVHVIARTAGARRRYFYRKLEGGSWTAWEQVGAEIEDVPVIPVVWRGRLFLFWVRLMHEVPPSSPPITGAAKELVDVNTSELQTSVRRQVTAVLEWTERFNGSWQPVRTSDIKEPAELGWFGPAEFKRKLVTLSSRGDPEDGSLVIGVGYGAGETYFRLFNTHSLPVRREDEAIFLPTSAKKVAAAKAYRTFKPSGGLTIEYFDPNSTDQYFTHEVLRKGQYGRVVEPRHPLRNLLEAPFFYQDRRHVFFVQGDDSLVKIPRYPDIGIIPKGPKWKIPEIPPIVLIPKPDKEAIIPEFDLPYPADIYTGFTDPSPLLEVVRTTNITKAIATLGTFAFGGKAIAPDGAVSAAAVKGVHR